MEEMKKRNKMKTMEEMKTKNKVKIMEEMKDKQREIILPTGKIMEDVKKLLMKKEGSV